MNDIESLKKRITELEKANRELESIFNAMSDLVFVIDKDNIVVAVNDACAFSLKTKPQNLIGKRCHDLVHKLGKPWPGCPFEKTKADKKIHTEEISDPAIGLTLLVTTSPIFNDKGEMSGAVHVAKDITELKNKSNALRENELKYRAIFDNSSDAVMILAPGGRFLSGNTATIKLFGCKNEGDFAARTPGDLSPEYQPDGQLSSVKAAEMMRRAMERGSNFFEWTHRRVNGEEFFTRVMLTRLDLGDQTLLHATVYDITEQVLSEKRLAKRLCELEIFYKAAVDREMKIKELKKRVAMLEAKIRS